jgi:hypothetical protein
MKPALQFTNVRIACSVVVVLAVVGNGSVASAQQSPGYAASQSQEIRQSAEKILSSPEFRNFKRLERGKSPFGSSGGGSGSGGSGGSSGSGGGSEQDGTTGGGRGGSQDGTGGGNGGSGDGTGPAGGSSSPGSGGGSAPASSSLPSVSVPAGLGAVLQVFAWLMLIIVAGVIIFLVVMAIKNYDGGNGTSELTGNVELQGEIEPESPPGELPVDVYLAEARKLAAAGEYREAIAQLLLGAMSYAERAGLIRYRRGLTQRDYLHTLRGETTQYDAMRTMVRVYEPLGFGRRTPAKEHFDKSVSGYEQAFRNAPKSETMKDEL